MYTLPTTAEFKTYFYRDFPFAPIVTPAVPAVPEIIEDLLADPIVVGVPAVPAVPAVYSTDADKYILDMDIDKAIQEADAVCNQALFNDQASFTIGFQNFAAHNLCMNIRASSQGLNGAFDFLTNSKSVGSVSISNSIPDTIAKHPLYAYYVKTNYGAKYLMMILPQITGQIFTVCGGTRA